MVATWCAFTRQLLRQKKKKNGGKKNQITCFDTANDKTARLFFCHKQPACAGECSAKYTQKNYVGIKNDKK